MISMRNYIMMKIGSKNFNLEKNGKFITDELSKGYL